MPHLHLFVKFAIGIVLACTLLSGSPSDARHADAPDAVIVTTLRPLEGEWQVEHDPTIRGKVYSIAGVMQLYSNAPVKAIFPNRGDYDFFEAWVGYHEAKGNGTVQFRVRGDGDILYTSPTLGPQNLAVHIRVPIHGCTAFTLTAIGKNVDGDFCAVWAEPRLVKLAPRVPVAVSPDINETIIRTTPLVWKAAEGAAGYLLELQCVELADAKDEASENRFTTMRLPPDTMVYTFSLDKMPKGKWRWRVHALSRTGIAGEMLEWHTFTAK